MTSDDVGNDYRLRITDTETHNVSYYDPELDTIPTDKGTTHISIYDDSGDAVSLTSSINDW